MNRRPLIIATLLLLPGCGGGGGVDLDEDDMDEPTILWTGNLNDDCTAEWNGMMLRAEEMDRLDWWWAVYDADGEIIDGSNNHTSERFKNGTIARQAAESAAKRRIAQKS